MQRYFNVVLADLQFYRYNEEMAVAYIQFDRIRIRQKLGQHTEVEVAEKEVEYNKIRRYVVIAKINKESLVRY